MVKKKVRLTEIKEEVIPAREELLIKIEKLDGFIKKTERRIKVHEKELEKLRKEHLKELSELRRIKAQV